jgi:hypothetical protein
VIARELAGLSEQARAASGATGGGSADRDRAVSGGSVNGGRTSGATGDAPGADGASGGTQAYQAVPEPVVSAKWAWLPLAAVFVPGIAFALSEILK